MAWVDPHALADLPRAVHIDAVAARYPAGAARLSPAARARLLLRGPERGPARLAPDPGQPGPSWRSRTKRAGCLLLRGGTPPGIRCLLASWVGPAYAVKTIRSASARLSHGARPSIDEVGVDSRAAPEQLAAACSRQSRGVSGHPARLGRRSTSCARSGGCARGGISTRPPTCAPGPRAGRTSGSTSRPPTAVPGSGPPGGLRPEACDGLGRGGAHSNADVEDQAPEGRGELVDVVRHTRNPPLATSAEAGCRGGE